MDLDMVSGSHGSPPFCEERIPNPIRDASASAEQKLRNAIAMVHDTSPQGHHANLIGDCSASMKLCSNIRSLPRTTAIPPWVDTLIAGSAISRQPWGLSNGLTEYATSKSRRKRRGLLMPHAMPSPARKRHSWCEHCFTSAIVVKPDYIRIPGKAAAKPH